MDDPNRQRTVVDAEPGATILVVEDEPHIGDMLAMSLRFVGYDVVVAVDGAGAVDAMPAEPALVLLDVMLPDTDGFELLHRLRTIQPALPAVFLTARDAMEDKLNGLTIGGDDYITKPFSLEEVVARIGVVLRRSRSVSPARPPSSRMQYADLVLDEDRHQVWRHGAVISLSPTEFALLGYLLRNSGNVVSRSQILDHVWNYEFAGGSTVVESYIRYLRRKIDVFDPPLIQTIRGVGYSLRLADGG